jgi:hypothetical protein
VVCAQTAEQPAAIECEPLPLPLALLLGLHQQSRRRHVEPVGEEPQGTHADIAFAALGIADIVGAHLCPIGEGFLGEIARLAQPSYRQSQGAMAGAERRHSGTLPDPAEEVHQLSGWFPCKVANQFQTELCTYRMNRARTIDLRRALSHPARRRVLRQLHDQDRPCSSVELVRGTGLPVSSMAYHLRVLQLCRVTKPIERQAALDPTVPGHQSAVSEDRWLRTQLEATKTEDEADRPGAARPR